MQAVDFSQLNTLIRIKETKLLTQNQFERMLQGDDLAESIQVLRETDYAQYINNQNAENPEQILKEAFNDLYEWGYQSSPVRELVDLFTLRYTYHNLKVLTKAKFIGENLDDLLIPCCNEPLALLKLAVNTNEYAGLPATMVESIEEVRIYLEEYEGPEGIDFIYDRYYLRHLMELTLDLGDAKIIDATTQYIDMNNISVLIRAVTQSRSANFLNAVLSSSGSIPKAELVALGNSSLKELTEKLKKTEYGALIDQAETKTGLVSASQFDVLKDNKRTDFLKQAKFEIFGMLPFMAYMFAREMEFKNLRLIFVGKRNGLSEELLKERMRAQYVI